MDNFLKPCATLKGCFLDFSKILVDNAPICVPSFLIFLNKQLGCLFLKMAIVCNASTRVVFSNEVKLYEESPSAKKGKTESNLLWIPFSLLTYCFIKQYKCTSTISLDTCTD